MPIGDSITLGAGSTRGGYRRPLQNYLTAAGYIYSFVGQDTVWSSGMQYPRHEGHGGWSTMDATSGRADSPTKGYASQWVTTWQPDIILLMLGTNDPATPDNALIKQRYDALLDSIFAVDSSVNIIMSNFVRSNNAETKKVLYEERASNVIQQIVAERQTAGYKITFIDNWTNFNTLTMLSDKYHPNDTGYQFISNNFANGINALLATPVPIP